MIAKPPRCVPCIDGNHDWCNNTALADGGGLTSCFCTCWDDERSMREYVSRLWAEDWDSVEDAVYNTPPAQMGSSTDAADTTGPYAVGNDQQGETT